MVTCDSVDIARSERADRGVRRSTAPEDSSCSLGESGGTYPLTPNGDEAKAAALRRQPDFEQEPACDQPRSGGLRTGIVVESGKIEGDGADLRGSMQPAGSFVQPVKKSIVLGGTVKPVCRYQDQ